MAAFPGVFGVEEPFALGFENAFDEVADAAAAAGEARHEVGGGADLGDGVGRADAETGELDGRDVGDVVADEGHLPRLQAVPLAEMQEVFGLVFRDHIQVLVADAQRVGAVQEARRHTAGDEGARKAVVDSRPYAKAIFRIELAKQVAVGHRQHQPVGEDPVHIERKGLDVFKTRHFFRASSRRTALSW